MALRRFHTEVTIDNFLKRNEGWITIKKKLVARRSQRIEGVRGLFHRRGVLNHFMAINNAINVQVAQRRRITGLSLMVSP